MFEEYKMAVREAYLEMKKNGQLSSNMDSLQRSKIRDECLLVLNDRPDAKYDSMLRAFFCGTAGELNHEKNINRFDLDRFRPLVSFLKEGVTIRDDNAVKLIAWLLQLEDYQDWLQNGKRVPLDIDSGSAVIIIPSPPTGDKSPRSETILPRSIPRILLISLILLGLGRVTYVSWQYLNNTPSDPTKTQKCMYWTGNHFEPIDCNRKVSTASVVNLDIKMLHSLKRIQLPDTLTQADIGKVWYTKVNSKPIFFTHPGINPIDTSKRLLPLSSYMLKTHLSPYRYVLSFLIWMVCSLFVAVNLSFLLEYLWRRFKHQKVSGKEITVEEAAKKDSTDRKENLQEAVV